MNIDPVALSRWLALVAPIVAAFGFFLAILKYFNDRTAERERRLLEANKPFLDRQLELYFEAVRTARTIATSGDPAAVAAATTRFFELYWGELALVEDEAVEGAMVAFSNALDRPAPADELKLFSLALAHACRESLAQSWKAPAWKGHSRSAGDAEPALDGAGQSTDPA
jgi:hypothetical protein